MIERYLAHIENGTCLSCRASGTRGRPLLIFLHGFPEGAFVWDTLLEHFADPAQGGFRCVAPNLRGFEKSSAPPAVDAYRASVMIEDVMQLAARESADGGIHALIAHDWGGAFAWGAAHTRPERIGRLAILNAPHPATFARELKTNPEQQRASAYMHFLCRPDAEARLAADDYALMWRFMAGDGGALDWLTAERRDQYRALWHCGLAGGCNLYRATPLKPPLPGVHAAEDIPAPRADRVRVVIPTLVLWGMADAALRPSLLDGLERYVPDLSIQRFPDASHWIVHERPNEIKQALETFLGTPPATPPIVSNRTARRAGVS